MRVARVAGRAEMRIEADAGIGELGHVDEADEHETGAPVRLDERRILLRWRIAREHARARGGHASFNVEQILPRAWDAIEWAQRLSCLQAGAGGRRLASGALRGHFGEDRLVGIARDCRERLLDQVAGVDLSSAQSAPSGAAAAAGVDPASIPRAQCEISVAASRRHASSTSSPDAYRPAYLSA